MAVPLLTPSGGLRNKEELHMHRFSKRLAILASVMALVAVACGGDDNKSGSQGAEATKEPIKIGAIFDLSGPTSDVGKPYSEGIVDYVAYRNAQGGVDGHKIELSSADFGYKVPNGEQLYSQYVAQGVVAFMGWGTADTEALRPKITADKIPFMSASYAETLADPKVTPYNFFPAVSYSDQMRIAVKWVGEQDKKAQIAVFHHDSPFGQSPLKAGEEVAKELGLGYKAYAMPAGATDFVGQLSQAKGQGAKYVILQQVSSPAAKLAQNIASEKLGMQVVCLNWCGDELFIRLAGPAAEGAVAVMPYGPPTVATSGLKDIEEYLKGQNLTPEQKGLRYVQGWFTMAVMAQGMEEAVKAGGKVDGPAIKEGLEKIKDFDTGGVSEPITFTSDDHAGIKSAKLYKIQGEKFTKLTEALSAD
jgi:branched-chain amino acid transport system substrate-binding protein